MNQVTLRIADIIIRMQSRFELKQFTANDRPERFNSFIYRGKQKPDIEISVKLTKKLPQASKIKPLFVTYHFQDGSENWRLIRKNNTYIYISPLEDKNQVMLVNETLDKVTAYVLPSKNKDMVWCFTDILYDFLQVLLICYLAQRNSGIFAHAIGMKDINNHGMLFAGKSGAGKSTTAKLWYRHSRAMVLNDDRIIVRKRNGRFFIYGSPWHGEFSDYLASRIESAQLEKIFFIYHASENKARKTLPKVAFSLLYPAIFPTFWDKECLENIVSFSQDLLANVPCYSLGFVNNKEIIKFVRKI